MDADNALNVQNSFFNQIRKDRSRINVLFTNGQKVSGIIRAFDKFTFLLDTKSGEQIVFKHAVASVSMNRHAGGQPRPERRPAAGPGAESRGFGNFIDFKEKKS
ncbi:MAG: RNA chaperone Hfq [Acidobacteriota bacterium]